MKLTRKPDWQTALDCFLVAHRQTQFLYGRMDCCLFVCDAILAMTGVDVAAPFRGRYASRKQAMRIVEAFTGRASVAAIAELMCSDHGMPEVPLRSAQRGDVVLIERRCDYSLGVIDLTSRLAVPAETGFLRIPLTQGCRAWRV